MNLLVRGLVWFGLYVVLTLLPFGVAWWERPWEAPRPFLVEASVATGLLALPLMVFQFGLVSRLRPASRPFGTDSLMQFHAQMGLVALAAVVLHPVLLLGHGVGFRAWNPFAGPPPVPGRRHCALGHAAPRGARVQAEHEGPTRTVHDERLPRDNAQRA